MGLTIHIIAQPHTIPTSEYSECAFTNKTRLLGGMLTRLGHHVVEYANEGSSSEVSERVPILPRGVMERLFPPNPKCTWGSVLNHGGGLGRAACQPFEDKVLREMGLRVSGGDIICHPMGPMTKYVLAAFPENIHVETGIGYSHTMVREGTYRIFESQAWRHYHLGMEGALLDANTCSRTWVIPNYLDPAEWPVGDGSGGYIAFMARLIESKGLPLVARLADMVDIPVVARGSGDPSPWRNTKILFESATKGVERAAFLGKAICLLSPTAYIEPFGCVVPEAHMCGTPTLTTDYGAFTETVVEGFNGFRGRTATRFKDYLGRCGSLDRGAIARDAREKYNMDKLALKYDHTLHEIVDMASGVI